METGFQKLETGFQKLETCYEMLGISNWKHVQIIKKVYVVSQADWFHAHVLYLARVLDCGLKYHLLHGLENKINQTAWLLHFSVNFS